MANALYDKGRESFLKGEIAIATNKWFAGGIVLGVLAGVAIAKRRRR